MRLRLTKRSTDMCAARRWGANAVEFAFVAPVFFVFVLGLVEVSRGFMVTHQLNSVARDACRLGVLQGKSNTDIQAVVDAKLSSMGIANYTTTVKVNDTVANANTAVSNDQLQVSITVPVANITWLPAPRYLTGNLYGQFNLRRE